jgi:hypothetical protein
MRPIIGLDRTAWYLLVSGLFRWSVSHGLSDFDFFGEVPCLPFLFEPVTVAADIDDGGSVQISVVVGVGCGVGLIWNSLQSNALPCDFFFH